MALAHNLRHFLKEERHQKCRDMCSVHISVGHDDDPFIAQQVGIAVLAAAAAERLDQVGDFAVRADLV